jgi:hypothetical protein
VRSLTIGRRFGRRILAIPAFRIGVGILGTSVCCATSARQCRREPRL